MPKSDDITPLFAAERAARLLIEEAGADAVVILWTTQRKRSTQFWRHQIGNAMLCNAMVMKSSEDQETATEEEDEDE